MTLIEISRYEQEEIEIREKSFEEILNRSIILIDKHRGPTSYSIDRFVSNLIGVKKVGHAGTLDPNASGLLPILISKANKCMDILKNLEKEYVGIAYFHEEFDEEELRKTIKEKFIGEIIQVPPVRSAVARYPRKRKIYSFDVLEIEGKNVLFKVKCEAGVYIRKLVFDLGKTMNINAHLKELRRISVGEFKVENAINIYNLKEIAKNKEELKKVLIPVDIALSFLKKVFVKDSAIKNLIKGSPLYYPGIVKVDDEIKKDDLVAIYSLRNELIAIGIAKIDAKKILEIKKGIFCKVDKVLY